MTTPKIGKGKEPIPTGKEPITISSSDNSPRRVESSTTKRRTVPTENPITTEGRSLYSWATNFIEMGTDGLSKSYQIICILSYYAMTMLIKMRERIVRSISKCIPPLPTIADEFIKYNGQRIKIQATHFLESRTLEKVIHLVLTHCIKRSNINVKEEASRIQKAMKHLGEQMSDEIAEIYSLKEGKLELLTNTMSKAFNKYIFRCIFLSCFKVIKYIFDPIADATRKLLTRQGFLELVVKMALHTFLMEELGPRKVPFDTLSRDEQRNCTNITDIGSEVGMCMQEGLLGVITIKFIVFCMMISHKITKVSDLIYPVIGFYLMNGPFYFLKKAGKRAIIDLLILIDKRLTINFFVKVLEILTVKSVLKRFFEDLLRYFFEKLGLDNSKFEDLLRYFFEKLGLDNSNFEEVSKTLGNFTESIKSQDDLTKLVEKIERLSFKQKQSLFDKLALEEFIELPLKIRNVIFDFFSDILLFMSNEEFKDFFVKDCVGLIDKEKQILYDYLNSLSPERKQKLRKLLCPIFNDLDNLTKKPLYRTLEFNLNELFLSTKIPENRKTIEYFLKDPLMEQEVFKLKKLSGEEKISILGQLNKIENISNDTRKLLFKQLIIPNGN